MVELGISTFGETTALEATGQIYSHDEYSSVGGRD